MHPTFLAAIGSLDSSWCMNASCKYHTEISLPDVMWKNVMHFERGKIFEFC